MQDFEGVGCDWCLGLRCSYISSDKYHLVRAFQLTSEWHLFESMLINVVNYIKLNSHHSWVNHLIILSLPGRKKLPGQRCGRSHRSRSCRMLRIDHLSSRRCGISECTSLPLCPVLSATIHRTPAPSHGSHHSRVTKYTQGNNLT